MTGQLNARARLTLAQSFIVMGCTIFCLGVVTRIAYKYLGGQSSEKKLVAYRNEVMEEDAAKELEMQEIE